LARLSLGWRAASDFTTWVCRPWGAQEPVAPPAPRTRRPPFANPAGMTLLDDSGLVVGVTGLFVSSKVRPGPETTESGDGQTAKLFGR